MHRIRSVLIMACVSTCCVSTRAADVVAIAGQPFGVGRITLPVASADENLVTETNGVLLTEGANRVFYPAVAHRRVLGLLRDFVGLAPNSGPSSLTIYFLFKGDEPLELTLHRPQPKTLLVTPKYAPRQFLLMQRAWWQQYAAASEMLERNHDYPPVVETYLSRMLGQRLGLSDTLLNGAGRRVSTPKQSLLLVLNVESMRIQCLEDTLRGNVDLEPAKLAIPDEIPWSRNDAPPEPANEDIEVEPIAMHIPEECFYVRFGSFDNYLWLRKFTEQNGGDASRLLTLRGHDALLNQRLQEQLGLKETALAELLGNKLISDVALLGQDTYLQEGAAIGILFEARANLLKNELSKQQREATERLKSAGAIISDLVVGDQNVSFAFTPTNELRSFYVVDDRYHLVTNSMAMVERFVEVGQGIRSLGQSNDFRMARSNYPPRNNDTIFAYLSPAFFRGLVSPQYQIELRRRLRAVTDLEIVEMARLAAIHEHQPHESIDELIAAGLLPPHINQRPDGSHVVMVGDQLRDSLRGARGTFLPIPDVPLQRATTAETDRFAEMSQFHQRRWSDMDPLVLQLTRTPIADTPRERIDIRAEMLPFDRRKYGFATSIVGPPLPTRVRQPSRDAITFQMVFQGGLLNPQVEPRHLFFGIRDEEIPVEFSNLPLIRVMQILRSAPAYFGAWPELGLVDLIPLRQAPVPDDNGLTRLPFGLWQMSTENGFSLVGVDPAILSSAASELQIENNPTDAQLRLHITDVSQSKIQTWFAALDFQRAYQTSVGNTKILHTVRQQLGVPVEDAKKTAEQILGVQLICALGGEYQVYEDSDGFPYWGSTNWPSLKQGTGEQGKFASPTMAWFRGLDADVRLLEDRVSADAVLEVQKLQGDKLDLPFFNLLRRK